ncbi:MAG: SpoIID/LytB domain-containing protein [Ruminococcus sp.]|nr:SpoIID/LytB domain-containing protein [Ruminococcus sp.]
MDLLRKKNLTRTAAAAAGIACAMTVGSLFPTTAKNTADAAVKQTPAVKAVSAPVEDAEPETIEFIEFRKAGIDEYALTAAVTSVPETDTPAEEKEEQQPDVYKAEFAVSMPADGTKVYDPQPAKQNYTATRSVANEFYTVYDLVSKRNVTMNATELLCRMVYNEIGDSWNEEAIKAQIVAAYSHLRFSEAINFIPQVGLKANYTAKIKRCVAAVEGQCVYYNGGIINAVYAASFAGYSCDSSKVFGASYGYLKPVVSAYDTSDPNWGTVTTFAESYIRKTLEARLGFKLSNNVSEWFKVGSVFSGKYVDKLIIDGGKATMTGQAARKLFGLKSAAFEITYKNGVFSFKTYGFGHGVGMSQWGAKLYADHGYSYDQILRHYYVNTTVKVSETSAAAVKRGGMSAAELESQIKSSTVASAEGTVSAPVDEITVDKNAVKQAEQQEAVQQQTTEKPKTEEKPAEEKPAEEKPAEEDKPAEDTPAEETPAEEAAPAE